jgi:hypothetical protein
MPAGLRREAAFVSCDCGAIAAIVAGSLGEPKGLSIGKGKAASIPVLHANGGVL